MGKPQGDELPDPVHYTREVDGETVTRPAYTPADHVNLQARGWTLQDKTADDPHAEAVAKRVGSQRREHARPAPSAPHAGEPGTGASNA